MYPQPLAGPGGSLERVTFGDTDLEVTPICFGSWQYGNAWAGFDEDEAVAAVETARELGINFFDTAQAYGWGRAEELLGDALADDLADDRDDLVIATKGGLNRVEEGVYERDSSPAFLEDELESSLDRLGVDHVDIYQVHWPDDDVPFEETAEAMDELRGSGRVGHVGVSNYDVAQMEAFREGGPLDALQPPFSMLRRDIETDVLRYCRRNGIGVLVYGPLAHGLLTGKYDADTTFPDDDWRSSHPAFAGDKLEANARVVDRLQGVADGLGCTLPQLAVAWTLQEIAVDAAIVGARNPEHIEETAGAVDVDLSAMTLKEIEEILDDAEPIGGPSPEGPIEA